MSKPVLKSSKVESKKPKEEEDEQEVKKAISKKLVTLRATKFPVVDPTRGMLRIPMGQGIPVDGISPWLQSQIDAKLVEEI